MRGGYIIVDLGGASIQIDYHLADPVPKGTWAKIKRAIELEKPVMLTGFYVDGVKTAVPFAWFKGCEDAEDHAHVNIGIDEYDNLLTLGIAPGDEAYITKVQLAEYEEPEEPEDIEG